MGIVTSPRGLSGSCRRFRISKAFTKAVMPGLTRHLYQIAVCGSGCLRIYLVLKDWVGMPADLPGFERLPREFVFQWRKVLLDKAIDSGFRRNDGGVWRLFFSGGKYFRIKRWIPAFAGMTVGFGWRPQGDCAALADAFEYRKL